MNFSILFEKINQKHLLYRKNNKLYLKNKEYYVLISQNDTFYTHMVEKIPNKPHDIIYKDGDYYDRGKSNKNDAEKFKILLKEASHENK